MTKKKKADYVVLSELESTLLTLLYKGDLYGIQFVTAIQAASEGQREVKFGSLYPTLTRMDKKGYVSWYWGDEQVGPRRKYYSLTPYGRKLLEASWHFQENLRASDVTAEADPEDTKEAPEADTAALNPVTAKN